MDLEFSSTNIPHIGSFAMWDIVAKTYLTIGLYKCKILKSKINGSKECRKMSS